MTGENKRRSERAIPCVSDEEMVVIQQEGKATVLAKLMDLSEVGALLYVLRDGDPDGTVSLSIYHQGKVFDIPSTVIRKNGRLIAFEFENPSTEALREVQSKLIRMEVDWMRLSRRG
jgi:hypothetical protein